MSRANRRQFIKGLGCAALAVSLPGHSVGAAGRRVVVVGGGSGGATAALNLLAADPSLQVTLIERNQRYTTCYKSNEVVVGQRSLGTLSFGYGGIGSRGVTVVIDEVIAIDPVAHRITTRSGTLFDYDRCIVSPGIDVRYETVAGYSAEIARTTIPCAWQAGPQTTLLRDQLAAMPSGGTVVIAAPPNPFRCPPGPYERVSLIAEYCKQHKPAAKIIILDHKAKFSKQPLFFQGWTERYGYGSENSMIEWRSGDQLSGVVALDVANRTAITDFEDRVPADVMNIIPAQQAGAIAHQADLVDQTGWCPVNPRTFESTRYADIHIIGDACIANQMPKSAFSANAQAKNCAVAVVALLNGHPLPMPSLSNVCYSTIGKDYAILISALYRLSDDGQSIIKIPGSGGTSPLDAGERQHRLNYLYAESWYDNFTRSIFPDDGS